MTALRTRGTTTDSTFHLARSELNAARERWHETRASMAQTERKITEAQQEKTRLSVDAATDREGEVKAVLQAIAEEKVTRDTIASLLLARPALFPTAEFPEKK